ncbi:hypothetical protein DVH05_019180 [Phytophthora capsici]|nr:hypothetical protein DVH05_019180 [Phytophthora capsici]
METIGKRIAHMDMYRGFAMEQSSTVTVIATLFKQRSAVFVSLSGWRKMSSPMMGSLYSIEDCEQTVRIATTGAGRSQT